MDHAGTLSYSRHIGQDLDRCDFMTGVVNMPREGAMWETVGIPSIEASVYEALIPHGMSTVDGLHRRLALTPPRITKALTDLIGRGLVKKSPGRPARYTAIAPSLAGSVLIAKR